MSLHVYLERLKFIDNLIRRRATGDAQALAKKLNLSRSQTLEFLKQMREQGFPIEYSRQFSSYYYSENGKLVKDLFEKNLPITDINHINISNNELRKISGGKDFLSLVVQSDYIGLNDSNFV